MRWIKDKFYWYSIFKKLEKYFDNTLRIFKFYLKQYVSSHKTYIDIYTLCFRKSEFRLIDQ